MPESRSVITAVFLFTLFVSGCEREPKSTTETKSKAREAVEEVVTGDFKIYEGAKKSLGKIERDSQERKEEIEKELK